MDALIYTRCDPFRLSHDTTASTDTSFASKIPTLTEPSGQGVIEMVKGGTVVSNGLMLVVTGQGSDNDTLDMRVIAWNRLLGTGGTTTLWVPTILAQFACTLCQEVGVAAGALVAADRLVDIITLTTGNANISNEIVSTGSVSNTANKAAHIVIDTKGAEKIEIIFDLGAGSSANCLYKRL